MKGGIDEVWMEVGLKPHRLTPSAVWRLVTKEAPELSMRNDIKTSIWRSQPS